MTTDPTPPPGPQPAEPPRTFKARLLQWLGSRLARHLSREPPAQPSPEALAELDRVAACLQPGDVILVEGRSRFSIVIKYLTQSTWSHAALFVGETALAGRPEAQRPGRRRACVVEADLVEGVRAVELQTYAGLPLRICRPTSLGETERAAVVAHAVSRLGHRYDLKHIFDLLRWLLPAPPVPARFRRDLLTLGSGDPTRAICSTLVAEAMQAVRYPILPEVRHLKRVDTADETPLTSPVLHRRHASLFVPRDFDLSPYFEIVKPRLVGGFDHRRLVWGDTFVDPGALPAPGAAPPRPQPTRRRVEDAVDVSERRSQPATAAPEDPGSSGRGWLSRLWR